jgi:two-component system NtrC family sensor kinase
VLKTRSCKVKYCNKLLRFCVDVPGASVAYKLHYQHGQNSRIYESLAMNAFPVPFRIVATILLSCILVAIGVLNLRDRAEWTDPTDGVFWVESEGTLKADTVDPEGPGSQAGISPGDRLLYVNDQAISDLGQYVDSIYQVKPGAQVVYRLAGAKGIRSVIIHLGSRALFTAKDGLKTLLAFLHLGIGVFVLLRGDLLPRTFHFYLICLAAFVVYLFSWTTRLSALDWWVYGLQVLAFLLLPALFVHFCLRFPVDVSAGGRRIFLLYVPVIFLGMLHLFWMTGYLASLGLPRTARSSGIIDHIELAFFCVGFIFGGALIL